MLPGDRRGNFVLHCIAIYFAIGAACLIVGGSAPAQVNVLTYHNDLARLGQNTNENRLTLANVNTNTFARLFSHTVDGQVYTQPLYVSGVAIPGQGTHNVVFVATQHNTVYAFDADSRAGPTGGLLWQTNLEPPAAVPNADFGNRYGGFRDIFPEVGITSTPVIDPVSGTIYVNAFTHEGSAYFHRLHALNITNGTEWAHSPVTVAVSIAATGAGSSGGILSFQAKQQIQRCALTLAGGIVYLAFAGYGDSDPYHGWVLGYRASDLAQLTNYVFNTTPNSTVEDFGTNAGEGGIWMSGCGLAADAQTNLYLIVGNGIFNPDTNHTEYGDSFLRLSTSNRLAVADYFTPFNQDYLADFDVDLGSGGALVLPDEVGSAEHPHLVVGCGKEGRLYVLDRDNLGRYNELGDTQVVQSMPGLTYGTWSSGAYFNHQVYFQPINDVMRAFQFTNGVLNPTPASHTYFAFGFPGATPSISANGTDDGIVWTVQADGYGAGLPAILHAFAATNVGVELYNSSQAGSQDALGPAVKYAVPTVVNGKVYVGASHELAVFGLATFIPPPVISSAGRLFTNSTTVTITNSTPGAAVYYTLDGSSPTTDSALYTGTLTFTNSVLLTARAIQSGTVFSHPASSSFVNTGVSTLMTNSLREDYYPGQTAAVLESQLFPVAPASIQYPLSFESPMTSANPYAERVSGYFIPPQTGEYVFFVCAGGVADFFLSTDGSADQKHLIARETVSSSTRQWTSSAGGSDLASKRSDQFAGSAWPGGHVIALTKGNRYYLEGVHEQDGGTADFAVTFKLAGSPDPVDGAASLLTGEVIAADVYDNVVIRIVVPPADAFGAMGGAAQFGVSAATRYPGTRAAPLPPLSYQWQAAAPGSDVFANIPGANTNIFTKTALSASLDGTRFRVVLTSVASRMVSSPATLHVGKAPAIASQPANASRGTGASAVFTVAATGSAPLSYQWLKNGAALPNDPRIAGATGPSLTISNLQFSDAGSFSVVINNTYGSATNKSAAVLTVLDHIAPTLAILSHTNLQSLATNHITLAGIASDGGCGNNGIASVKVNGVAATSGTAKGAGTANWSRALALASGTNIITVVATDSAGNATTSIIRLVSDSTRPTVTISAPTANQRWSNAVFTVKGTARDDQHTAMVWCQSGGVWTPASSSNGWASWTAVMSLAAGTNIVRAYAVDWIGNRSATSSVPLVFVVTAPLTVQMTGHGSLAPNYSNAWLEIGRSYTVTPTPARGYVFSNWVEQIGGEMTGQSGVSKLTFLMHTNLALEAHFIPNPFGPAAGSYQGLFYNANGAAFNSSGLFSATLSSNGTFTAKLQQGKNNYSLSGQFSIGGGWSTSATIGGAKTAVGLQLDLASGDFLGGQLSNAAWTAGLSANRSVYSKTNPAPMAGKYSLVFSNLATGGTPGGSGAFNVDTNGNVLFSGTLGDGSKLTESALLSSQNQWPLYLSLYGGNGVLLGWVTLTNGSGQDVEGVLSWIKTSVKSGNLVRPGFTNALDASGSGQ